MCWRISFHHKHQLNTPVSQRSHSMRTIQTARSLMFSNNMVILATLILPGGVLAVPDGAATPAQQQMVREPAEPQEQNMTDTVVIAPTHTGKRIVPPYDPTNPPKPKLRSNDQVEPGSDGLSDTDVLPDDQIFPSSEE